MYAAVLVYYLVVHQLGLLEGVFAENNRKDLIK